MKRSLPLFRSFFPVFALCILAATGCLSAPHAGGASAGGATPAATGNPTSKDGKAAQDGLAARKLVKNATLNLVVKSPASAARSAEAIARSAGGYVNSSENTSAAPGREAERNVELVLKVPADRLANVLGRLEKLAPGVASEQVKTEDVTDRYVDLSARLNNQQALEAQYLQILKSATRVQDALDVQKRLASVRTTIEKLEGEKRLLDHQIALSTIRLTLSKRAPLVSVTVTHFGESLREAGADAVNIGAAVITGGIRLLGALLPLALLVLLPLAFGFRWMRRRARRAKPTAA